MARNMWHRPNFGKSGFQIFLFISLLFFFNTFELSETYAIQVYSENDLPFGTSLDDWISKWWNWWLALDTDEATPKPGGCLVNKPDSIVMLMNPTVTGKPHQICTISSAQGIMVPLWGSFLEDSTDEFDNYTYAQLSRTSRERYDLGAVTSIVKVDNNQVAKLDVVSSMPSGSLNYIINSMNNVIEIFSEGFNITIPEDTNLPDQNPGTWRSGAHGWFVFLKPLPPGNHTLYYNVGVTGTGPNDHSSEITYDLKVE